MFRPRIIPCLLLKNKGLVKTTKFKNERYIGDPINAVKIFNDNKADELIFLDINASNENREPSFNVIKKIAEESFMPFSIGGGIRELSQIHVLLSSGAEKVCLNTILFKNPNILSFASEKYGSQSLIAVMDLKKDIFGKYRIFINRGRNKQKMLPCEFAEEMSNRGVGEIMINNIDLDGTMIGFDYDLINDISSSIRVPLIVSGGAGDLNDCIQAFKAGASAVAIGSLFVYHGKRKAVLINYPSQNELMNLL